MKFDPVKLTQVKSPKTIGQLMLWGCGGMAYFNLFSSLNLSPGLQFGLSGVLPMAALIGYLWLKSGTAKPDGTPTKLE